MIRTEPERAGRARGHGTAPDLERSLHAFDVKLGARIVGEDRP
jgi:hypothetical protein